MTLPNLLRGLRFLVAAGLLGWVVDVRFKPHLLDHPESLSFNFLRVHRFIRKLTEHNLIPSFLFRGEIVFKKGQNRNGSETGRRTERIGLVTWSRKKKGL